VALANHLFVIGFRTVILEGDFWFGAERDAWRAEVQTGVVLTTVLLRVSLETARQRVQADEQRADSHNPVLLAQSRADFQNALSHLTPPDLDITTDALDIEAVARTIVDAVDR
jgi:predicted kinase